MGKDVDLLLRNRPGTFSIERVFDAVIPHIPGDINIRRLQVPRETAHFHDTLPNIRWCSKNCGDIVHVTGDINYCTLGLSGRKVILTIHDTCLLRNFSGWRRWMHRKLWFDWALKHCSIVTCVSEFTRKQLSGYGIAFHGEMPVINNPVGNEFSFSDHEFNMDCPRILHFNITENKNLRTSIEALKGIKCHLRIIGKPSETQLTAMQAASIEYSWAENLSSDEIIQEYKQCDMLCFPSTFEGFGMPIPEAQTVGRPVITSNLEPMSEVAGQGAALLVNPCDASDIRHAIERITKDTALRDDLVSAGKQNARRFSPQVIAKQYAELY